LSNPVTAATSVLAGHRPVDRPAGEILRLDTAQALLGHHFTRPELLREALTHRSAATGRARHRRRAKASKSSKSAPAASNERLEFIGDRVLGLVMAEWVAERFPAEQEGDLGSRFAHLVSREAVCGVAEQIGLTSVLSLGSNEALAGVGRLATVLADAMEAVIGAIYLDSGLPAAQAFIRAAWHTPMQAQLRPPKDPKTELQEFLLARSTELPDYKVASSEGPSHAPVFVIEVTAHGRTGRGEGASKRMAERAAATDLLRQLK
jgi:ribonuclease-3